MKRWQGWLGLLLILLVAALYTWAEWRYFTERVPGGNDFMAHYTAWQAYFEYGYSPYSDEAALYTQMKIRGRPAKEDEDQNRLTYPFYSILIHAPFILVDYALARAIYMTLLQAALFAGVIWSLEFVGWRPPPWLLALILVWSLLFYPEARGVILGQFAIFGFFSVTATLHFLARRRDILAAAVLALATIKPTLIFLAAPLLLVWALTRRRWIFIGWFLGILALLVGGSFFFLPTWLSEWLLRMGRYGDYTVGQSPVWLLSHQVLPALDKAGEMLVVLILLAGMLWSWWRALRPSDAGEFYWALGITLVVSSLVVPRSATTNYVMLLLPTLWIFAILDRLGRAGRAALLLCMLVSFAGLWWLHFATVAGNQEQPILFIPYPVTLGLALLVSRRWLSADSQYLTRLA